MKEASVCNSSEKKQAKAFSYLKHLTYVTNFDFDFINAKILRYTIIPYSHIKF